MTPILVFKLLTIILIMTAGLVGGLIPLSRRLNKSGHDNLVLGNAFAGGVFLGAGLMHMLPDAIDNFKALQLRTDFPLAPFLAGVGFILVLSIEKVIARQHPGDAITQQGRFPFILFLVLAIHSIIAGMSLGLETTLLSGVVIFIAIIAHKGSAAFSLGVNMVQSSIVRRRVISTIIFFSVMTPLGILLGSLLSQNESSRLSIGFEAVFDSLAAGTFLYIAILEIIEEVFETDKHRFTKFVLLFTGFLLMAVIALYV